MYCYSKELLKQHLKHVNWTPFIVIIIVELRLKKKKIATFCLGTFKHIITIRNYSNTWKKNHLKLYFKQLEIHTLFILQPKHFNFHGKKKLSPQKTLTCKKLKINVLNVIVKDFYRRKSCTNQYSTD